MYVAYFPRIVPLYRNQVHGIREVAAVEGGSNWCKQVRLDANALDELHPWRGFRPRMASSAPSYGKGAAYCELI